MEARRLALVGSGYALVAFAVLYGPRLGNSFMSAGVLCLLAAALSLRIRGHARTGLAAQPAVAEA